MLFCGLVAWKCHVCFFLCKDVTKKKEKKKKSAHVSYIYLYTHKHSYTHGHAHTHSRADLTVYFVIVHESPWVWKPLQQPLPPASVHKHTHTHFKNTHTSHALIFLAIVQQFYSSKPYHKSLHSCSISLYQYLAHKHRRQASAWIVLIVFPRSVPLLSSPQKW